MPILLQQNLSTLCHESLMTTYIYISIYIYTSLCLTFLTPPPMGFIPYLGSLPTLTVAQSISPSVEANPWPFKRSELPGSWQMHRYYICTKYFANKLTTLSLLSNEIYKQQQCSHNKTHLIQLENNTWFTKKNK